MLVLVVLLGLLLVPAGLLHGGGVRARLDVGDLLGGLGLGEVGVLLGVGVVAANT